MDPEAEWKMGHLLRIRAQVLSALEDARKDKYGFPHDTVPLLTREFHSGTYGGPRRRTSTYRSQATFRRQLSM